MNKILSICIPTYNRCEKLNRLIKNIEQEINGIEDQVEVCISDNCSTDDTENIVNVWQKKLPIIYLRNSKNIGFDLNVINVTNMATGRYIWFSGNDDIYDKNAVKKVLSDLRMLTTDVGAIYIAGGKHSKYNRLSFNGMKIYTVKDMPSINNLSFMGTICLSNKIAKDIIKRDMFCCQEDISKQVVTNMILYDFMHVYLFLECCKASKKNGIISGYGVCGIGDGDAFLSCNNHIRAINLHIEYIIHLKKYYADFDWAFPKSCLSYFIKIFLRYITLYSIIYSRRTELEKLYEMQLRTIRYILNGNSLYERYLLILDKVRMNNCFQFCILKIFSIFKMILKIKLEDVTYSNIDSIADSIYEAYGDKINKLDPEKHSVEEDLYILLLHICN